MAGKKSPKHASQQSVNSAVKGICNIMRRSNCAGALQYVPELTWILFLRILDEHEEHEADGFGASRPLTDAATVALKLCDGLNESPSLD